jgi:predicted aspartyl protease
MSLMLQIRAMCIAWVLMCAIPIDTPAASAGAAGAGEPQAPVVRESLRRDGPSKRGESVGFTLFRDQRIFVAGIVNGQTTEMLIDSAARPSTMSQTLADSLGIKGSDSVSVHGVSGVQAVTVAHGVRLSVGSLHQAVVDMLIMDLSPIEETVGRSIPLIIGRDILERATVTFDFQNRHLTFFEPALFLPPSNARQLALTSEHSVRSALVSINGGPPIPAQIDLGNPSALLVSNDYSKQRADLMALPSASWQIRGVGGLKNALRVTIPQIELAGIRFNTVPAILNEDPEALPTRGANLGLDLLRRFNVTLDYARDRMYLQPSATGHFRRDRAGAMLALIGDRLRVTFVSPQSPAAAAGLRVGDELTAINGQSVSGDFYLSPASQWNELEPGTPARLTKADGTNIQFKLADFY